MPDRLLTRNFILAFGAHFVQAFGYSSLLLFPVYLDHLGASRTEIGSIMAVSAIGSLAVRPLTGWALDAVGRKPVLIGGTLLLVLAMGLIAFVDKAGPMAYLCRWLFGLSAGALFPGYFALAADIVPEKRRTEGLAIFGLGGLLPLAFNPVVARIGIEPGELALYFPMVGGFILVSLALLVPIKERARPPATQRGGLRQALRSLVVRPLLPVWVATVVFSMVVSVFMTFATVSAAHRMVADPADLWFTYALGATFVRLFGAKLPDRIGTWNIITPSIGVYILGLLLLADAQTPDAFLLAGLCAGMGHGYCFPVLTSQAVSRVNARLTGSAMALFTAIWELVSLLLTPLFGLIADREGDGMMFFIAAIAATLGLGLWAVVEARLGPGRGAR